MEEILLKYAREYLQRQSDLSREQIRRMQIELEPLTNAEKRRVKIQFLSEDEVVDSLTLDMTSEQEPKLFQKKFADEFYFLQNIDEQISVQLVDDQLKELFKQRYSLLRQGKDSYLQLTEDFESQMINNLKKIVHLYANRRLSSYSREECMRIAIKYSFDDLLDATEWSLNLENNGMKMMMDEIQTRLRSQIERRFVGSALKSLLRQLFSLAESRKNCKDTSGWSIGGKIDR